MRIGHPSKFATNELERARLYKGWLSYNSETGVFTWVKSPGGQAKAGKVAGTVTVEGYRKIRLKGQALCAHRLAWFFVYDELPEAEIDHIDGNRDNNAISNLRKCETFENCQNWPVINTNTSGFAGVNFCKSAGKWRARIMILGKRHSLGLFTERNDAAAAYLAAKSELHTFQPTVRQ